MSINDKQISNTLKIVGDNHIIFTSGSAIVVKDFPPSNGQTVVSKKGCLRNISAMDAWIMIIDQSRYIGLVIGESSTTENVSISIHMCIASKENSWATINTSGIGGDVKRVHVKQEKKLIVALIQNQDDTKQQSVLLWNYYRDKLVARQALPTTLEDVSFHPVINKRVLFRLLVFILRQFSSEILGLEFQNGNVHGRKTTSEYKNRG